MRTVFEAAGGIDGLRRLAAAWHRRVMADEVVGQLAAVRREVPPGAVGAAWGPALGKVWPSFAAGQIC